MMHVNSYEVSACSYVATGPSQLVLVFRASKRYVQTVASGQLLFVTRCT